MNLRKEIIAKIRLLFRSLKAKRAKKKLLEAFKSYPQSIRKLSAAYENFLKAVQAEQRALVTLKALKMQYSGRPILMKIWDIGQYRVSRKAKEILSETDIACALERHKCGDWGEISREDWERCNACMETGYGYVYSRYKTAGNRYFCVITDQTKQLGYNSFLGLPALSSALLSSAHNTTSILRSGAAPLKNAEKPKISDPKREDFFVLEGEERRNTAVFQVMRQAKRENTPFRELLYPDCFVYSKPKNKIVTEEELLNVSGNSTGAVYEKSEGYPLKKAG